MRRSSESLEVHSEIHSTTVVIAEIVHAVVFECLDRKISVIQVWLIEVFFVHFDQLGSGVGIDIVPAKFELIGKRIHVAVKSEVAVVKIVEAVKKQCIIKLDQIEFQFCKIQVILLVYLLTIANQGIQHK